ncbi:MAG: Zn-ribbon domain-containing OB-fold protein [Dehalococcoidia bacterium]
MPDRPQPRFPEPNTERYWNAVKEGKLTYQQCADCSTVVFTPRILCTSCGSSNLAWKDSKGEGKVYTYTVVRQNRNPAFAPLGAYVLAWIDLDEGFRMLSNVVGVADPTKDVACDARVKVDFEKQDTGEYPIPVFRLV